MSKPQPSAVEEIAATIPARVGSRPWYERVTPEQAQMLADILAGWQAGAFGRYRKTASISISQYLERHGILIGWQGVDCWLRRNGK